jgi:hypothetical protein
VTLPANLTALSREEIADLLTIHVMETNLLMRALILMGVPVAVDTVERVDPVYPQGRPEFIVSVGEP